MSAYDLPTSICVAGTDYEIRSDFRAILDVMQALNDNDLESELKPLIMLGIMFKDPVPAEHAQEALDKAVDFIEAGYKSDGRSRPKLMDWEQDANLIIPAVNKVAGQEIRALPYLHWWTFLGYYMEIQESFFSTVVGIRLKKSKGQKLDKQEKEFYQDNKAVIDLKKKANRSKEELDELRELFGLKKG